MIHERVDGQYWKGLFPLTRIRDEAREWIAIQRKENPNFRNTSDQKAESWVKSIVEGNMVGVTGPRDVAIAEQLRDELLTNLGVQVTSRVPVDRLVLLDGEPADRRVTKIGGLPYWPAARPWPATPSGDPMAFVAQFCFADSRDIAGGLPGDIMLFFAAEEDFFGYEEEEKGAISLVAWVSLEETELVSPDDVPAANWSVHPCYGAIYRSWDCHDPDEVADVDFRCLTIGALSGSKIGGLPHWIQCEEDIPGQFLCALSASQPDIESPWPWLNRAEPYKDPRSYPDDLLVLGDVGCVYFFIDSDGCVRWTMQC